MNYSTRQATVTGLLLVASLLLAACGGTPTATAIPPAGATASDTPATSPTVTLQPTAMPAATATDTAVPIPTDTAVPSATPAPTSPPQPTAGRPAAERISFAAGTTSATVAGSLTAQEMHRYVLGVMAGQLMELSVDPQDRVQMVVYGADGTVLKSGMGGGAFFRGTVPGTQDYIVELRAGAEAVSYSLMVMIPVRISFAPGATSAVVEGGLAAGQTLDYVLNIAAGQMLDINVSPQDTVRLVIYGADGTVLKSGMGGGAFFRGTVPGTQDYIVGVGPATVPGPFTMNVIIPARISFAPGATSATVQGNLAAHQTHHYILRARGGQMMEVEASPEGLVRLIIYGVDGTVLAERHGEGASFSGTLPGDQDYIVAVGAGPQAVNYSLEVSIQ